MRSPLESLIEAVSGTLLDRRISTSVGGKPMAFTLSSVNAKLDPFASTLGQADHVTLNARDVEYDGLHIARAQATLHNVHTRVGISPVLVTAPVDVTFIGDWTQVDDLVHRYTGAVTVSSADARTATIASTHHPLLGMVDVEVAAENGRLRIRPVELRWRGRRVAISRRLPPLPVPTNLGSNARLREVRVEQDEVHVVVRFDQWRVDYPRLWSFVR
ncbi:DUF2993 domain-containing protein [Gordonia sp. TBRC 11910]|uniref:DUF2993 domain-containing protein n=1 Tax=Gordonia asplenii TaxID=2725283 RepID=A0A848KQR0_9ACTN|nr:LmeA family phospholipid-binding protein [Gordonia asplenii]NMO00690.1 DUF2993 domain-containing protein [Gordonia asplenii]